MMVMYGLDWGTTQEHRELKKSLNMMLGKISFYMFAASEG